MYYKIQGVLLPNTGKDRAASRLIWGETLTQMIVTRNLHFNQWESWKLVDVI